MSPECPLPPPATRRSGRFAFAIRRRVVACLERQGGLLLGGGSGFGCRSLGRLCRYSFWSLRRRGTCRGFLRRHRRLPSAGTALRLGSLLRRNVRRSLGSDRLQRLRLGRLSRGLDLAGDRLARTRTAAGPGGGLLHSQRLRRGLGGGDRSVFRRHRLLHRGVVGRWRRGFVARLLLRLAGLGHLPLAAAPTPTAATATGATATLFIAVGKFRLPLVEVAFFGIGCLV